MLSKLMVRYCRSLPSGLCVRLKMFCFVCRSKLLTFLCDCAGGILAATLLIFKLRYPSSLGIIDQPQAQAYQEAQNRLPAANLDFINRFFWYCAAFLFSMPLSVFESLYLVKGIMNTERFVERALTIWTFFFAVSGIALYHSLDDVVFFLTASLELGLGSRCTLDSVWSRLLCLLGK